MTAEEMESRIMALEKKMGLLEDVNQIKRLQYAYSYYVMRMMNAEIVDCFADHPETGVYWLEGAWLGKEGVRRYFGVDTQRPEPLPEFFHQVMPIAGVIDVEPDGKRAKARWYTFGGHSLPAQGGAFRKSFVAGIYEMEYIKQNAVWKFLKVYWLIPYAITIRNEDWRWPETIGQSISNPQAPTAFPAADIPFDPEDPRFMAGYMLPFHYGHPVTGVATSEQSKNWNVINSKGRARP
ncbi:MAG TPA: nuclear transport factor 2 family protein [Dehalococcoidales bacterium]|nr:nuclear transport factor 2 family protein [Dehalococcoidales bacterium]